MQIFRLCKIFFTCLHFGLHDIVLRQFKYSIIRFFFQIFTFNRKFNENRGIRIRQAFEILGPIFVKFGQTLSTRLDLIPHDIADELTKLQDQVKPFNATISIQIIEKALNRKIEDLFINFEELPAASASIAQIHFARIKNGAFSGHPVAIKVLRPGIIKIIESDLAILKKSASILEKYFSEAKRLRAIDVVKEFEKHLHNELDFLQEAANASQLKRNFEKSNLLVIPKIYWDYCSSNVLVMEKMDGIPINQINNLQKANINLRKLAQDGVEIFFTQVFRDGFFHADMHPGNIFVSNSSQNFGQYIALDFGIVGSLSDYDKNYLAQNFLAFFNHDYHRVAVLHVESGWAPKNTRVEDLEGAIRCVCEPYFDQKLKDISLGRVLLKLFQTSRRFNINIQPQLILLQKTLFSIEGLGRQLDPNLNLWETAKPFLEKWTKKQVGIKGWLNHLQHELPQWSKTLPEIPRLFHQTLLNISQEKTRHTQDLIKLIYQEQKKIHRCNKILTIILSTAIFLFFFHLFLMLT